MHPVWLGKSMLISVTDFSLNKYNQMLQRLIHDQRQEARFLGKFQQLELINLNTKSCT